MEENGQTSPGPPDPKKSRGMRNILDAILLLAVLAAAWFVIDRLMDWMMGPK